MCSINTLPTSFDVVNSFLWFIMATIKAIGSLIPFTLPLQDNEQVIVLEDMFGSRFNFQIGTMYVKQEMYFANGEVCKMILMQKKKEE